MAETTAVQGLFEAQRCGDGGAQSGREAQASAGAVVQDRVDAQNHGGDGTQNPSEAQTSAGAVVVAGGSEASGDGWVDAAAMDASDPLHAVLVLADQLDDIERTRIAAQNRYRSLTTTWIVDGTIYGKGLPAILPECVAVENLVRDLEALEHRIALALQRALRQHPLHPWMKAQKGIGEKQGARLLAAIRDPLWNAAEDRMRRGPAELWAYCGFHVVSQEWLDAQRPNADDTKGEGLPDQRLGDDHIPVVGQAPRRRKGQKANWNDTARMRARLVAESCLKAGGSYAELYRRAREKYADATHALPCPQCGPTGKPAVAGSPLSDGHKHARALRIVAKAILKDLFLEAKRLHEATTTSEPRNTPPRAGSQDRGSS